jgi:hypothetical protein
LRIDYCAGVNPLRSLSFVPTIFLEYFYV